MSVDKTKDHPPQPDVIRRVRVEAGHTQESAAMLIGVAKRTWQDWERAIAPMHPAFWAFFLNRIGRTE